MSSTAILYCILRDKLVHFVCANLIPLNNWIHGHISFYLVKNNHSFPKKQTTSKEILLAVKPQLKRNDVSPTFEIIK